MGLYNRIALWCFTLTVNLNWNHLLTIVLWRAQFHLIFIFLAWKKKQQYTHINFPQHLHKWPTIAMVSAFRSWRPTWIGYGVDWNASSSSLQTPKSSENIHPPLWSTGGCEWVFEKQTNHAKEHEYMLCLISQLPRWGGKRTKRHQWRPFFNFHRDHSGKTLEKWWRSHNSTRAKDLRTETGSTTNFQVLLLMEKILHRLWCPKCCFYTSYSKPFRASQVVHDFFHQPYVKFQGV